MLKTITALAAAFLCVSAAPVEQVKEGRWSESIPPERFRVLGLVPVVFAKFEDLPTLCGVDVPPGKVLMGCTRRTKEGVPIVFMPDPCPVAEVDYYARIACHELAHAGGWPGDHPR